MQIARQRQQVGKDEPLSPESDQDDYVQIQPQVCFLKVSFKGCKFDFDDTDYLSWWKILAGGFFGLAPGHHWQNPVQGRS